MAIYGTYHSVAEIMDFSIYVNREIITIEGDSANRIWRIFHGKPEMDPVYLRPIRKALAKTKVIKCSE